MAGDDFAGLRRLVDVGGGPAVLLVVEAILPERAGDAPEVIGFTVQRVVRLASSAGLGVVEAAIASTTDR